MSARYIRIGDQGVGASSIRARTAYRVSPRVDGRRLRSTQNHNVEEAVF
ncbi:hypothetical protein OKW41_002584 [Paraburkholderia sp. UCT70]|uniref:Uncharacterized protein n=1 Tax=Paraburkholderia tuberum TaxID=157910 RepID=A0A1H1KGP9_9BURK|nr:hypothetical protein SAMN05445850_7793 [Paraburkholderia tuberum]